MYVKKLAQCLPSIKRGLFPFSYSVLCQELRCDELKGSERGGEVAGWWEGASELGIIKPPTELTTSELGMLPAWAVKVGSPPSQPHCPYPLLSLSFQNTQSTCANHTLPCLTFILTQPTPTAFHIYTRQVMEKKKSRHDNNRILAFMTSTSGVGKIALLFLLSAKSPCLQAKGRSSSDSHAPQKPVLGAALP